MANQNQIRFNVGFDIDKSNLGDLRASLQELQQMTTTMFKNANPGKNFSEVNSELVEIKNTAEIVESALTQAFNPKLGTINITTFNNALKSSQTSIKDIYNSFSKAGTTGQIAFQKMATSVLTTNTQLKQSKTILDNMATTLANTVKWNLASAAVNKLAGSVQQAYGYVKSLDGSLNDIMIVTQKSAEEMDKFANSANKAAQNLGRTTTDYTNASLTFYQQGLNDTEVAARTDLTLKVANASGLDAEESAQYVTAVLNAYKVGAEEAEAAMDILANVGAHTASSLSELSKGMSKVASSANAMGVSEEKLAAMLATTISVTRQEAASIGTAYKTIFARISDIEAGTEDAEVSLGNYTKQMAAMGVNVLDSTGKLRNLEDVLEDIGSGWKDMTREQQISLAQTMAGTRQYNNLIALFDNWDSYVETLKYANNATGTLQQQQDTYMQSTEAHLNKLKAAEEDLFDSLLDSKTINSFADGMAKVVKFTASWVDALGGGGKTLLALGSIATSVFSNQIAKGFGTMISNAQKAKMSVDEIKTQMSIIPEFKTLGNENIAELAELKKQVLDYGNLVSKEQMDEANGYIKIKSSLLEQKTQLEENQKEANKFLEILGYDKLDFTDSSSLIDAETATYKYTQELDALIASTEDAKNEQKNFKNALDEFVIASKKAENSTEEDTKAKEEQKDALSTLVTYVDVYKQKQEKLTTSLDKNSQTFKQLEEASKKFNKTLEDSGNNYNDEEVQKALNSWVEACKRAQEEVNRTAKNTRATIEAEAEGASQDIDNKLKNFEDRWAQFKQNLDAQAAIRGISQLVSGIGQLASAGMTLANIKNVLENENLSTGEKTLQLIQQLTSAASMFAFGLSNLSKGYTALVSKGPELLFSFMQLITAEDLTVAANELMVASNEKLTLSQAKLKIATDQLSKSFLKLLTNPYFLGAAAVILTIVIAVNTLTKAYNKDADAAKELAEQVNTLKNKYEELSNAAKEFKNQVSDYSNALDEFKKLEKSADNYKDKLEEVNNKAKELIETYGLFGNDSWKYDSNGAIIINDKALASIQNQKDQAARNAQNALYMGQIASTQANLRSSTTDIRRDIGAIQSYYTVDGEKYKGGKFHLTNEQLQSAAMAFNDLYKNNYNAVTDWNNNEEIASILVNQYGEKWDETLKGTIEELLNFKNELKDINNNLEFSTAQTNYFANQLTKNNIDEKFGNELRNKHTIIDSDGNSYIDEGAVEQIELTAASIINNRLKNSEGLTFTEIEANAANRANNINTSRKLADLLKEIGGNWDVGLNPNNQFTIQDDIVKLYNERIAGIDSSSFSYSKNGSNYVLRDNKNQTEQTLSYDFILKELARKALTEQVNNEFAKSFGEDSEEITNFVNDLSENAAKAGEKYGVDFSTGILNALEKYAQSEDGSFSIDFSSLLDGLNPEEFAKIQNLNQDDVLKMLGISDESELESKLGLTADQFWTAWQNALADDKYNLSTWEEKIRKSVSAAKTDVESLIVDMQAGKLDSSNIADNEQYQDLLDQLDNIVEKDKDLEAASEILKKTWLAGTQEYIEALEYVQDRLYSLDMDTLVNETKESYKNVQEYFKNDRIFIEADTEGFEEAMEDLLDKNYQIDVAVHAEAEQEFDSFVAGLNNASDMASKIGENFIVAGEDLRELNNAFPGVLEGMQFLADGTVQLNEQIVQSAMESAEAEAKADAQATIDKLKDQAILLRQKQATYERMAEAAAILAKSEVATDAESNNARAVLSAGLEEIKELNTKASTQYALDSDEDIANSSNESASVVSANWSEAYNNAALAAYEAAKIQINAANAVEAKDINMLGNEPSINIAYKGSTKQGSEARVLNDTKDYIEGTKTASDEVWASIANQYRQLAEAAGVAANDVEGMIYEVSARLQGADGAFGNIASGRGPKGSSGGGSGGPDQMDYSDDDIDRYHDINIQIALLTRNLDRLKKAQDKLVGKDLINNLSKQLSILKQQRDAYAEKIQLAKEEAAELQAILKQSGASFYTNTGEIANYAQLLTDAEDELNSVIAWYNSLSEDAQDDLAKAVVEAAKQDYDNLKASIERYEEVINDVIPDLEDQITDALYEEIAIQIEAFDMELQIRLDMSQAERDWNAFKKKVIDGIDEDDLLGRALSARNDWLTYYNTRNSAGNVISDRGPMQAATDKVNNILKDLFAMDAGGHGEIYSAYDENTDTWVDDRASAIAALKDSYTELMNELEALVDLQDEVQQAFLDSIDAVQDAFDKQSEIYEFFGDQIDHDIKMVQMLYGDDAFDKLNEFYEKQVDSDLAQVHNLKNQVDYWRELMDAARGTGDDDAYAKYRDNWMKTINDLNSKIEDWADDLATTYANTINDIIDQLNDKLTDSLGLDYIGEELDLLLDNADDYLDAINSAYALEDLRNKWEDAIDATDSLAAQKELNDLMEKQLDYLEQKGELTQYDIDRAEKEYEIALKQIALQEAQQNKSKMRLRRDSQGNYSYQFVTDEEEVAQAQRDLAAAQNELYNFDKAAYQNNLNQIYDTWKEFQDKIAQAYIDYADDDEARTEYIAMLQEQYGEKINRLTDENLTIRNNLQDSAFQELANMYNTDVDNFKNMTDAEKDILMNDLIPAWNSGVQEMADKFAGEGGFEEVCEEAFENLKEAADEYIEKQKEILDVIREIHEQIYSEQEVLQQESDAAVEASQRELEAVRDVRTEVQGLIEDYMGAKNAAVEAAQTAYDYWMQEQQMAAQAAALKIQAANDVANAEISAAERSAKAQIELAQQVAAANRKAKEGETVSGYDSSGVKGVYQVDDWHYADKVKDYIEQAFDTFEKSFERTSKYGAAGGTAKFAQGGNTYYSAYATGGLADYTGPAWLDGTPSRPELVLNQDDTQNMFAALKVLDSIVNSLGLNALSLVTDRLGNLNNPIMETTNNNEQLEQTIYITAQFEGQTSADEIQTALDNLVNTASQRAFKSRK